MFNSWCPRNYRRNSDWMFSEGEAEAQQNSSEHFPPPWHGLSFNTIFKFFIILFCKLFPYVEHSSRSISLLDRSPKWVNPGFIKRTIYKEKNKRRLLWMNKQTKRMYVVPTPNTDKFTPGQTRAAFLWFSVPSQGMSSLPSVLSTEHSLFDQSWHSVLHSRFVPEALPLSVLCGHNLCLILQKIFHNKNGSSDRSY